jgi:sulfur relay (sulfurtransferase) DsrC/TusE family protein
LFLIFFFFFFLISYFEIKTFIFEEKQKEISEILKEKEIKSKEECCELLKSELMERMFNVLEYGFDEIEEGKYKSIVDDDMREIVDVIEKVVFELFNSWICDEEMKSYQKRIFEMDGGRILLDFQSDCDDSTIKEQISIIVCHLYRGIALPSNRQECMIPVVNNLKNVDSSSKRYDYMVYMESALECVCLSGNSENAEYVYDLGVVDVVVLRLWMSVNCNVKLMRMLSYVCGVKSNEKKNEIIKKKYEIKSVDTNNCKVNSYDNLFNFLYDVLKVIKKEKEIKQKNQLLLHFFETIKNLLDDNDTGTSFFLSSSLSSFVSDIFSFVKIPPYSEPSSEENVVKIQECLMSILVDCFCYCKDLNSTFIKDFVNENVISILKCDMSCKKEGKEGYDSIVIRRASACYKNLFFGRWYDTNEWDDEFRDEILKNIEIKKIEEDLFEVFNYLYDHYYKTKDKKNLIKTKNEENSVEKDNKKNLSKIEDGKMTVFCVAVALCGLLKGKRLLLFYKPLLNYLTFLRSSEKERIIDNIDWSNSVEVAWNILTPKRCCGCLKL